MESFRFFPCNHVRPQIPPLDDCGVCDWPGILIRHLALNVIQRTENIFPLPRLLSRAMPLQTSWRGLGVYALHPF